MPKLPLSAEMYGENSYISGTETPKVGLKLKILGELSFQPILEQVTPSRSSRKKEKAQKVPVFIGLSAQTGEAYVKEHPIKNYLFSSDYG